MMTKSHDFYSNTTTVSEYTQKKAQYQTVLFFKFYSIVAISQKIKLIQLYSKE